MVRGVESSPSVLGDLAARIATIERWTREFAPYRSRADQSGTDLWVDLLARLARVGVTPGVIRADIQERRARGWGIEEIGPVLDALAMETYRNTGKATPSELAVYARALFEAMAERDACPLADLAAALAAEAGT